MVEENYDFLHRKNSTPRSMSWSPLPDLNRGHPDVC
jgi:hypothetical protein